MSAETKFDELKSWFMGEIDQFKVRLFGENNERLDFLIDSFSKLDQNQQKGVVAGLFGAITLFVILAFGIYFSQVSSLKKNLSDSFEAVRQLESLSGEYTNEQRKFDKLLRRVKAKTGKLSSFKSHFESLSRRESVNIGSLNEKTVKIPDGNPLSSNMNEIVVDVKIDNISLPKILRYLAAIEKGGKYMKVSNLKIRSRYGTKLYFDTQIAVKGYKAR
jgi:hypothetical protein